MVQYTVEQRVFIVTKYFETKRYAEVQRLFRLEFPNRDLPNEKNIWRNVQKYVHHGTSWNRNAKNSGRKKTARTNEKIDAVHDELIRNPDGVSCQINNLGLTSATFNRIVRIDDLKWHPYKIQRQQQRFEINLRHE